MDGERDFLLQSLYAVFLFSYEKNIIRWRDVKLCAFDNAKHRTYVDLKVKTCDPFCLETAVLYICYYVNDS